MSPPLPADPPAPPPISQFLSSFAVAQPHAQKRPRTDDTEPPRPSTSASTDPLTTPAATFDKKARSRLYSQRYRDKQAAAQSSLASITRELAETQHELTSTIHALEVANARAVTLEKELEHFRNSLAHSHPPPSTSNTSSSTPHTRSGLASSCGTAAAPTPLEPLEPLRQSPSSQQPHDVDDSIEDLTAGSTSLGGEPIYWESSRVKTAGVFLPAALTEHGEDGGNALCREAQLLATLSRFPDSRYAPNIVSHVRFTPESSKTTEDAVRAGLKKGLVVVVDDIPPSLDHVHDETIGNLDFWRDCMGCNVEQVRDFQDMRSRVQSDQPYQRITLRSFCETLNQPGKSRCILDLKPGKPFHDPIAEGLAEGHQEMAAPSHSSVIKQYDMIPSSVLETQHWCLAHEAGFLTPPHADAFGLCTSIEVVGAGHKIWVVLRFSDDDALTYTELLRRGEFVVQYGQSDEQGANSPTLIIKAGDFEIQGCVIVLRAGQRIFQPPGQAHVVFTPTNCTSVGKQFLCYVALHLTEYARRLEAQTQGRGTNQNLDTLQVMVIHMAAALPARLAAGQVFYKKPLIALCRMVLQPHLYISARIEKEYTGPALDFICRMRKKGPLEWVDGHVDRIAAEACSRLKILLGYQGKIPPGYLLEGGGNWRDPGEEVDTQALASCLQDLVNITGTDLDKMFDNFKVKAGKK
ncbi:hypothetical protein GGF50DRAFT_121347 [Schizophyllum commune]